MKRFLGAIALLAVGAVSADASTMSFSNFTTAGTNGVNGVVVNYTGLRGAPVTNLSVRAGELKYTVGTTPGPYYSEGDTIITFCIDIWDNANSAGDSIQNIGSLTDTPLSDQAIIKMEGYRADLIKVLWTLHRDSVAGPGKANEAAAFQMAIWEIAHEDNFAGDKMAESAADAGLVLNEGALNLNSNGTIFNLANGYLSDAYNAWAAGAQGARLGAAFGNGFQDVIIVIPLPAPVLMAGLGLLAIPLMRRRLFPR